jgi:hypothetical protein
MKNKIFLTLGVLLMTFSSFGFTDVNYNLTNNNNVLNIEADCQYGQCQATAKSTGNQCRHCVSNSGDLYCWQHK